MTTYFHVAPKSAEAEILARGILPMIKQFRNDEEAAVEAWMTRWADRMGRSVEEIDGMVGDAHADIRRVCVFQSLEVARTWASIETREMTIIEINDEDDDLAGDLRADHGQAADGEEGALSMSYEIDSMYLKAIA